MPSVILEQTMRNSYTPFLEAYAFAWNLRYSPTETRRFSTSDHQALMNQFGNDLWALTIQDLNAIKSEILSKY